MTCKHCSINNTYQNSKYGLCEICDRRFQRMIIILRESTNLINTTKNIETLINRCQVALEVLERLKEFEHLNYIHPSPNQLIDDVNESRSERIFELWEKHYLSLSNKLESIHSADSKIKKVEETKILFAKSEKYFNNPEQLKEAKLWIQFLIDQHITGQYNPMINEAKEFEKNREYRLAIKKLNEALIYFRKIKPYFEEWNQNLDIELEEWIERLHFKHDKNF